jgi:hypothetical protein
MPAIQHVPELLYDNVSTTLIKGKIRGWWRTKEWKNWSLAYFDLLSHHSAIPVAARSKAWVCSCSLAGNGGSNPSGTGRKKESRWCCGWTRNTCQLAGSWTPTSASATPPPPLPWKRRAVLWTLAHMVWYQTHGPRRPTMVDYCDYMRRSRWKAYTHPNRLAQVGNYLEFL